MTYPEELQEDGCFLILYKKHTAYLNKVSTSTRKSKSQIVREMIDNEIRKS